MIFLIISYSICALYVMLMLYYTVAWVRRKKFDKPLPEDSKNIPSVSLIIPVRNESANIPKLLYAIEMQTYRDFETIIVNDHSTDNSLDIIAEFAENRKGIKIIEATGEGKKSALKDGVKNSTGELIICTDADCLPHKQWVETIVSYYMDEKADMIIAPVLMIYNDSFVTQLQALEFSSLQASTAGSAAAGMPIMCNGANLSFTREAWNKNKENLNDSLLSGDDMFLMMSIKKQKGKVEYLKSTKAIVQTSPCENWHEFINQRKRWISKSTAYRDLHVILAALIVLMVSVVILANIIAAIFVSSVYWLSTLIIFLLKLIADRTLVRSFNSFTNSKKLMRWAIPLSILYPFYAIFTGISSLFTRFTWKGRKA